jgi:hypothetical protein
MGGNIEIDVKEMQPESMDLSHLTQNGDSLWPVVNIVMNFCIPQNVGHVLSRRGAVTFRKKAVLYCMELIN